MPLEIQSASLTPGATKNFEFSDLITQRLVGISSFLLSYGDDDHHVQTISVSLSVNQSGSRLSVTAHATMVDANGHNLKPSNSSVSVVAVAWVGVDNPGLKLGNANDIPNGGSSSPIPIPGSTPNILQAFLSGYTLSYGSTDHHMETAACLVGTTLSGSSVSITGTAYMYDDNGNSATIANVDGGLLANTDPSLGAYVKNTDSLQNSSQTLSFPEGVSHFFPLINSYKVQYKANSDHHVKSFGASLTVTNNGTIVTVTGAATLSDDSRNVQDDGVSYISGSVIAY